MNREGIIKKYNDNEIKSTSEFYHLVNTMRDYVKPPLYYAKGDVFSYRMGHKSRPIVLYKIKKDSYIFIPLTTTEDELSVGNYSSRFFGNGFFSKQLITLHFGLLKDNFIGVLNDSKGLNKAYKDIINHFI